MQFLLVSLLLLSFQTHESLKEWTDGPVGIILSDVEKKAFSQLREDTERQRFIDQFWVSRNPNTSSRSNEFKEEFEKRVDKANALFGGDSAAEGWRTERGRFYILLG